MSEQIIKLGWFSPVENPLLDAYPSVKFSGVLLNTRPVLVLDVATARAIASRLPHDEVLPIGQIRKNIFGVLDSDVPSEGPGPEDVKRLVDAANRVLGHTTHSDYYNTLKTALAPWRESEADARKAGEKGEPV